MKTLLASFMIATATLAWANQNPASFPAEILTVKGEVLEVKSVESYTYMRLKIEGGETWAAVSKAAINTGDTVTLENAVIMYDFESPTLKRIFPTILFGTLGSVEVSAPRPLDKDAAYQVVGAGADAVDMHVPKASGTNAHTVAEVMTHGDALKDQIVLVRGKVVKYSPGIMGKNWVHLRDGSGSGSDNTNDVLVTTTNAVKVGDVVTAKGIVRTDMDFGSGYAYKVLIEEATLE